MQRLVQLSAEPEGDPSALGSVPSDLVGLPCSMLLRDLPSVTTDRWVRTEDGCVLHAPQGSTALVRGSDPEAVVDLLKAAGPKVLQVVAALIDLYGRGRGGGVSVDHIKRSLGLRDPRRIEQIALALTRVDFLTGPVSARSRCEPGPPLRLFDRSDASTFVPGDVWLNGLTGARRQAAYLPASFLTLHSKNDRYEILLSWYLTIMLRVNRKHGFHYRVGLRNLLEGAGIDIPARNVSRFLAAIYRAIADLPGVGCAGPSLTLYSPEDVLRSKFEFWIEGSLLPVYRPRPTEVGP